MVESPCLRERAGTGFGRMNYFSMNAGVIF